MRRALLLVAALSSSGCNARDATAPAPATRWVYPPPPSAFPLDAPRGRIGRSMAPQAATREGIAGDLAAPLHLATLWPVPGGGPVRAVVYGLDGERPAIELVEIDGGRVVWRDEASCAGPVVGVTAAAIVCADVHGTRAVGLDGKLRWRGDHVFVAISDERVVVAGAGEVGILDAASGDELARVQLPANVAADAIVASCGDAGRELFAVGQDGKLARVVDGKLAWAVAIGGELAALDACDGASVLAFAGGALVAIAREGGKISGRVDGVRGWWPARDGGDLIELATATGVASVPRDLSAPPTPIVGLPALGELLAKRGERRLVRATPHTAALLDRTGVRAYLPLVEPGAVLGDDHAIAASWLGAPDRTVRRFALPPAWRRTLRLVTPRPPLGVPAELRDLPAIAALDERAAIAGSGGAAAAIALDAGDPRALYALAADDDGATLVRFDLAARAASWTRRCAGAAVGVAVAREVAVCATRGKPATVRAFGKDGAPRWQRELAGVDAIAAAGDVVVAFDADRATILDARDGRPLATLASDDGDAVRAAAVDEHGEPIVVTAERGRVVARLPRANLAPLWSLDVAGVVRAIAPAGDGVLVVLDDGDAYRVDVRRGDAIALPGLDLAWQAYGDVVAAAAGGEPVPPAVMPVAPISIAKPAARHEEIESAPAIAVPWKAPPPGPPAWQLTLYELAGGLRARNDYALAAPVRAAEARAPGAPVVAVWGGAGPALRGAIVIDPRTGDPLRRVALPEEVVAFSTVIDGDAVVGAVLANPLRVVLF